MKKNYANKSMDPEKAQAKTLVCLQEVVAPGYGAWKAGDEITDPEMVAYLSGNPNFAEKKEA